jgi:hypothetical protein
MKNDTDLPLIRSKMITKSGSADKSEMLYVRGVQAIYKLRV